MKKILFGAWLLSLIWTCAWREARAQSTVPETDNQSWNDVQLTVPMTKKVDFFLQGTLRIGGNLTTAVDERWGAGINFKLSKYVTLNELYFHREAKPPHGKQEHEKRLSFGATFQGPIGKFTLSDHNWVQRPWREPQVASSRYRNRV